MTAGLTVVILNWHTPLLTVRAARALLAEGVPADRFVIVDNASEDGSVEQIREELPEIEVLALGENVGFARGNNLGAAALEGERYLFVNSDAFVHGPRSLRRLLAALDDPEVGIAVPRLLNEDGTLQPSVVPFSTPLPELVRASGLSRFVPNRLQPLLGTHWDHERSRDVHAARGAVMLIRGEVWGQVGGFDERSFMYSEELDLFWRIARHGWRARFVADAEFIHLGGASAKQRWDDPQRAARVAGAAAEMIRQQLGPIRAELTIGLAAAGVGARAVYHRLRGDRGTAATMEAWFRGYLGR